MIKLWKVVVKTLVNDTMPEVCTLTSVLPDIVVTLLARSER